MGKARTRCKWRQRPFGQSRRFGTASASRRAGTSVAPKRLHRTGYLRAGRRHAPHLSYLERTDQAPGEVRERRGVEVRDGGVEAREEATVNADPVGKRAIRYSRPAGH